MASWSLSSCRAAGLATARFPRLKIVPEYFWSKRVQLTSAVKARLDRGPDDVAADAFGDVLHKQHATVIKLFRKPLFHHAVLNKPHLTPRSWGDAPNARFSAHSESTRAESTGRHYRSAPIKRELRC